MNYEIKLKRERSGRIAIKDEFEGKTRTWNFSTPDSNGEWFGRLFGDVKEGDVLTVVFEDIRICPMCGKKLEKKK